MIDSSTNLTNTASNKPHNYHEQSQIDQTLRLREVLKTLPPFSKDYFRAMEPKSSARTRINYAYDIRVFFHFLMENNPVYKNYTMDRFMPRDLENLEPVDIEEYLEYLKVYKRDEDGELINAGILDGDFVLVEQSAVADNGDIVVALLEDSATVKRFYKEEGIFRLQPENDALEPIIVRDLQIMGKVIGVFRFF